MFARFFADRRAHDRFQRRCQVFPHRSVRSASQFRSCQCRGVRMWHIDVVLGTSMSSSARRSAICRTFQRQATAASVRNRRVSPVAVRPGEGPLTEPTAGAQPRPQERVLMPRTGHCCCQAVCRPVLPLKRPPQEPMARYRRNEFGQASDLSARLMQIKVRRDSGLIALCAMKSPLSVAAALVPVSALAAETPAESYTWGHPMMWGWGWSGMIFGPLFMILVLAVVIAVAVLIVRSGSAVPGMVPRRRIIHPLAARRSTSSKSALHGAKLTRTSSRIAAACSASKRAVHTTVLILNDPPLR